MDSSIVATNASAETWQIEVSVLMIERVMEQFPPKIFTSLQRGGPKVPTDALAKT